VRNWERRTAEHRLQQMRAHQLREDPPVPVVRERKPRVEKRFPPMVASPDPFWGFTLWTVANRRQRLYQAALGE
jgi:hypothetical protein